MTILNGVSLQKTGSKNFLNNAASSLARWELLLLVSSGALAVVLHQILRMPLGLPGRQGVQWMALLVIGRAASHRRGAGTLVSLGAAATALLPFWRFDDPFIWLTFLLPGLVMDVAFMLLPHLQGKLSFLVSLGGLAHATKPLARWGIALASGWAYGSLLYGVAYPLATHLLFGLVGGFLGAVVVLGSRKLLNQS